MNHLTRGSIFHFSQTSLSLFFHFHFIVFSHIINNFLIVSHEKEETKMDIPAHRRFNQFLDPNTTAIEHVLTSHLLYRHLLYCHLLYRHLFYRHLLLSSSSLSSLDNTYINTALTRPTVSFGSPQRFYTSQVGGTSSSICLI